MTLGPDNLFEDLSPADRNRLHAQAAAASGTLTILFTDIVDATAITGSMGDEPWRTRYLEPHNKIIRACLTEADGVEVKTTGDGFLIVFVPPRNAIKCAVCIQSRLEKANLIAPGGGALQVRIGIHTGEAEATKDDFLGKAVNKASRVCGAARGGQVLISEQTHSLVKEAGLDLSFQSRGGFSLKGFAGTRELYEVIWGGKSPAEDQTSSQRDLAGPSGTNNLSKRTTRHRARRLSVWSGILLFVLFGFLFVNTGILPTLSARVLILAFAVVAFVFAWSLAVTAIKTRTARRYKASRFFDEHPWVITLAFGALNFLLSLTIALGLFEKAGRLPEIVPWLRKTIKTIMMTQLPPADPIGGENTRGDIAGRVEGINNPSNYAVVIYARTTFWFVQPESDNSLTPIGTDGRWNNWTHLGSNYAVLLVKKPYRPSPTLDALPPISENILAVTNVAGTPAK